MKDDRTMAILLAGYDGRQLQEGDLECEVCDKSVNARVKCYCGKDCCVGCFDSHDGRKCYKDHGPGSG